MSDEGVKVAQTLVVALLSGTPIELIEPEILKYKVFEPILLLGRQAFANVDMRIRVKGGGHTSQIYGEKKALSIAHKGPTSSRLNAGGFAQQIE